MNSIHNRTKAPHMGGTDERSPGAGCYARLALRAGLFHNDTNDMTTLRKNQTAASGKRNGGRTEDAPLGRRLRMTRASGRNAGNERTRTSITATTR